MIIDCISDLHGHFPKLEGGDLLIVAGDLGCNDIRGSLEFGAWIIKQEYTKKVVIAGNHDNWIENKIMQNNTFPFCEYLCDSGIEFEGLKIWGSPWCKWFPGVNPNCTAFMLKTEEELAEKWALIPRNIDILITHAPPFNFLDRTIEDKMVGSTTLLDWVGEWKPRLHIFGHVHEGYGEERSFFGKRNWGNKYGVTLINASHVNERYEPVNKPVRAIL